MNQKRYWLRGGIIGAVINIILTALIFVSIPFLGLMLTYTVVPFVSPFIFGVKPLLLVSMKVPSFLALQIVIPIIAYFIVGAIIGWLYGKVRNRKSIQ